MAYTKRMALCHPKREAVHGLQQCRACFQHAGSLDPGETRPPHYTGIEQAAAPQLLNHCPKCGAAEGAGWQIQERYARCYMCGADMYETSSRVVAATVRRPLNDLRGRIGP